MDLQGFFAMGGYGAYVWPAYGVALLVLAGLLAARCLRLAAAERAAAAAEAKTGPEPRS
jgi:heme exporter protein D